MNLKVGLDLGSAAIKAAFVDSGEMIWTGVTATAPGQEAIALNLIGQGLRELGLPPSQTYPVASTGYGKNLYAPTDLKLDELTANAAGLFRLSDGQARAAINIGGQDIKALKLSPAGKLVDFRMNDKCAAGTGRFFELAARLLDTPLDKFPGLSREPGPDVAINSTCVVFAETEIISLMSRGVSLGPIIRALHASVAKRAAGLLGHAPPGPVWLDGGPAMNGGLAEALGDELMAEVRVVPKPQFTVAYGAALALEGSS
ncbi:MAG: acyl-CoA dehydratase activase [Deltaproteobacteria bacterium]|jgi:predicted CoA-substrate-specific enzyme activase|nr:acyl-CoA dehydratase activase [Deltaproteobacteria bacterium]